MTFRSLLKSLVPPLFPAAFRRVFRTHQGWTWDGIYSHLCNVPIRNGTYDYGQRIREMKEQAKKALAEVHAGRKSWLWHDLLTTVAATASAATGTVKVVDFGGGTGTGFIQLLATLPKETTIEYHVIDLEGMCAAGRELFLSQPRIRFHTTLSAVTTTPDVVYVNSVIQYIEDYAAQLRQLAALKARWLLCARMATGNFPTFATRQLNLPGQVLAYWFLNRDEVLTILRNSGYRLALEELMGREYDQSNFPETHRIGRMRNLLFVRETSAADLA